MIKAVYDSEADVPEGLKEHYKESGGKWTLQVTGMKPDADFQRVQTALNNEREAHKTTKASLTAITETLGEDDTDPEKLREKLERLASLEAGDKKPGTAAFEAEVDKRVKQKIGPLQREHDRLKADNEKLSGEKRSRLIRDKLTEAAKAEKIRDAAIDDVLARESMFELDSAGNVVTRDGVGVTPGLAPDVWLRDIGGNKPHWFEPSQGGGAQGGGAPATGINPWSAKTWNMTEQANYIKKYGADKAAQMKKAAGYKDDGKRPAATN